MSKTRRRTRQAATNPLNRLERWKLEDAKAKFSELIRLASSKGPQLVTIRGKEAAVVVSTEDFARLLPRKEKRVPLLEFLQGLGLDKIKLEREPDFGRDITL
jgi:antitoxin Phd